MLAIGIDRAKKLNGFSPKMLVELAEAFTALERDEEAWVGVLFAHGAHFTAGLELDKVAPIMRERGTVLPGRQRSIPCRCGRRSAPSRWCAPCRASASRWASS